MKEDRKKPHNKLSQGSECGAPKKDCVKPAEIKSGLGCKETPVGHADKSVKPFNKEAYNDRKNPKGGCGCS